MKKIFLLLLLLPLFCKSQSQIYEDSIKNFIKQYVKDHEVVKGEDKKLLQFYPVNKQYCVSAIFNKKENSEWFWINTSGSLKQQYRVYGTLSFNFEDSLLQLNVYQSKFLLATKNYSNYLFVPFTDKTTGFETYDGGRYIDLKISDIQNNLYVLDFAAAVWSPTNGLSELCTAFTKQIAAINQVPVGHIPDGGFLNSRFLV